MSDKELQLKFLLFLAKKSGAKNQKDLEKYVQSLGEDGLKKAYDEFTQESQKSQAQKAAHGAKLNYFKTLKNQCAEDEEVYYFARGGNLECGCKKKMQEGGKTKKEDSLITKFKNRVNKVKDSLTPKKEEPKEGWDKNGNYIVTKKGIEQRKKEMERQPNIDEEAVDNKPKKNCGGSKMKLIKKGGEVCPKCGKVHKAGLGCAVAKFRANRLG